MSSIELVGDHEDDASFFRELESKGMRLNKGQIDLVRHYRGAALANSSAGSGKSSCMVSRLSYLSKIHKVDLSKVLLITFTKAAAEEMVARAVKLGMTNKDELKKVTAGTFHSVFLKVIRDNGETREILASDKSKQITIKMILRVMNINEKKYRPEDIIALISHHKNNLIGLDEYKESEDLDFEIYEIWKKYEKYKTDKGLIDFDDMLLNAYQLMMDKPKVLNDVRKQFQYIMVDEAQDSSLLQCTLVELVAHPNNNLVLIGDSDQCIFSFSGARIENIVGFPKRHENVKVYNLVTNYRCSNTILGLANHAIAKNKIRIPKISLAAKVSKIKPIITKHESTEEEASEIVKYIKSEFKNESRKYSDFAILFRSNSNSRAVFEELLLNDIPFTSYNSDDVFYLNGFVKPLLAYLRITVDPYDFQSISEMLPTLYIAKDKIKELGKIQQQNPIANPIEYATDLVNSAFQKSKIKEKIRSINSVAKLKPIVAIKILRTEYEKFLVGEESEETTSLHREIVAETLDELENSSKKFSDIGTYIDFVDRVIKNAKLQKETKKKSNYDSVKLMSIHRAKGKEFPVIFGIMQNELILPHKSAFEICTDVIYTGINQALEEENRLFYVQNTRAEEILKLSYVETHRGKDMEPSRFIKDYLVGG